MPCARPSAVSKTFGEALLHAFANDHAVDPDINVML